MFSLLGSANTQEFARLSHRLHVLERKIDLILAQLGIDDTQANDPLFDQVAPLLKGGSKIEAIKVYRQATGAGLKEAKDAVEEMASRLGL